MRPGWLPLVAEVAWHAGHRGLERPAAVIVAGERLDVRVEESTAVGPPVAGLPAQRVFLVRDGAGRRWRITVDSGGRAAVETERNR
jgi:hypothetical protein